MIATTLQPPFFGGQQYVDRQSIAASPQVGRLTFEFLNHFTRNSSSVSVYKRQKCRRRAHGHRAVVTPTVVTAPVVPVTMVVPPPPSPPTPPNHAIRTTASPTAHPQPTPPPPPLPPPAPDHLLTPCCPPGGTNDSTPPLATSLDAISATVEAAFERAVPELTHEWPHAVREAAQAAAAMCQGLLATGGAAEAASTIRGYNVAAASDPRPATMVARRLRSKPRQEISICTKKQIVRLRDADVPWAVVLRQLPIAITKDTGRSIMRSAAKHLAMPNDAHTLARTNCRQGKWPELDASLYKWYLAVYSLGHRRIPITTALLQEAACMISGRL